MHRSLKEASGNRELFRCTLDNVLIKSTFANIHFMLANVDLISMTCVLGIIYNLTDQTIILLQPYMISLTSVANTDKWTVTTEMQLLHISRHLNIN